MADESPKSVKETADRKTANLRAVIARGKFRDTLFAVVGAVLVFGSLTVLAVLIGDLVRDGSAKLGHVNYVKTDGRVPSLRDRIGKLERTQPPGEPVAWLLHADPIPLDLRAVTADPDALLDKRVIVAGLIPEPGEGKPMEVEELTEFPPPQPGETPARLGRNDYPGKLRPLTDAAAVAVAEGAANQTPQYELVMEPFKLDISSLITNLDPMDGKRVAVGGRRGRGEQAGTYVVDEVAELQPQSFFTSMPSRTAYRAGIHSAWVGSLAVMLVTVCTALPLGVAAGIYLEEYARKNWFTAIIEINIANLAGVPSIIWGLMALGLFVYQFGMGQSVMTAGLTLGLLVLPIVIIATREAIRAIPSTIRDASIALGATKWQTVQHHVLPYSMGGILTGTIVSLSRAIGETAPLITIGALTYVTFLPATTVKGWLSFDWLSSPYTVLPIQMFNWLSRPDRAFHNNAAAAGMVLIVMTLGLNGIAIYFRYRLRKRTKW